MAKQVESTIRKLSLKAKWELSVERVITHKQGDINFVKFAQWLNDDVGWLLITAIDPNYLSLETCSVDFPFDGRLKYELISNSESTIHNLLLFYAIRQFLSPQSLSLSHTHTNTHTHKYMHTLTLIKQLRTQNTHVQTCTEVLHLKSCLICQNCS